MTAIGPGGLPAPDVGRTVDAGGWGLERTVLQLLLVAGLTAVATSGWLRAVEGSGAGVAVALGSVAPPALALGASALRRRPWAAWTAVLGHLALVAVLAAVVAGGAAAAARAVTGGWARLLSTILPTPSGSEVEVLALVVAAVASALASELALRSRGPLTPAVPAVLALVATRMATQGVGESRLTGAAVALAGLAGALALVRAGLLRPLVGFAVLGVAALSAGLLGPALPWAEDRAPFDPRALREVAPVEAGAVNPLARLRAWQSDPDRVLFRADVSEPVTLRLTVLDRYDGARFSSTPRYLPAGSVLPPPSASDPGAGGPTRPVTADIVVAALDGPWVPAPARPTRVGGPPVAVDPDTGVMVAARGLRSGQRYRVESALHSGRAGLLATARPASPEQVGEHAVASPPALPPEVAALAADAAGDPDDPPLTRLGRLQELFRTRFSEDPASPPGHSLARLAAFLDPDDRVGSSEQLATAFAVLARTLGYPTRVAVGFRPSRTGPVEVRGADAYAWPEVALDGAGWVAFDPMPPRGATPGTDRPPPEVETAAAAAAAATTPTTTPSTPPVPSTPPRPARPDRSWWPVATVAGLVLVGVVLALLGWVVVSKRRRRSARRLAPDPDARVRGAWAEAVDRLVERGLGRPPSRTPREASAAVAVVSRGAAGPLADLGDLAERAAFAGPGSVADPDADRAWADLVLVEAALAAEDGRLTSLRRAVDPRPLSSRS